MNTASCFSRSTRRRGFTLIEVLMVIAILSILMAFLLPAIMGSMRAARITQVKVEINNIAAAIATFKQEFGVEPPSAISLCEDGASWDANSRALISRMWPQFSFTAANDFDFNHDGTISTTPTTLAGAECLVFFLGGVTTWTDLDGDFMVDTNELAPSGFSRNPAAPFSATAGNRQNPFYQFTPDRLIDLDTDTFCEYRDPLNATAVAPYVYFSSYDGSGYTPTTTSTPWVNYDNTGLMSRAYYTTITGDAAANVATSRPYNPKGYQIISAGQDGRLGYGGVYVKGNADPLPAWGTYTILDRDVERDNITNFSDGPLVP